tara:strand:+ start:1084 stop:1566 length:483 start_codon:yes stop_codon:yes gene_type:complete
MKITKSQLRKIIKEEISKELEEGPMDFMKKMMGPRDQGRTPETDWTVTLTNKAGKSGSWRTVTVGAHSEEEAAQKAKAQMDDHETVSRVEKALGEAKEKPSAGLSKDEKSKIAKKASAGKNIGKPGKNFDKVAAKAAKKYGSKEAGEKVAAAAMWKNAKR